MLKLLRAAASDGHDVLVLSGGVGHPLVAHAHLGEVEAADLRARPEGGGEPDGHAVAHERAVDLPRAQARSHAPDVLQRKRGGREGAITIRIWSETLVDFDEPDMLKIKRARRGTYCGIVCG